MNLLVKQIYLANSITVAKRSNVRSRPASTSVISSGGDTVPPVKATRTGCANFPNFKPCCSAVLTNTACTVYFSQDGKFCNCSRNTVKAGAISALKWLRAA